MNDRQRKLSEPKDSNSMAGRENQEIPHSEAHFRAIFENSLDAILLTAGTGEILSANPAAVKMFGIESEEEVVALGRDGIADCDDPRFSDLLKTRRQTGRFSGEFTAKRKDGSTFAVEATSAVYHDSFGREMTSLICRDVSGRKKTHDALQALRTNFEISERERTAELKSANESLQKEIRERMNAEEALRANEERFRGIFEGARDGILVVDPQSRKAVLANNSMCRLTGYPLSELLELSVDEIHPRGDLDHVLTQFYRLLKGEIAVAEDIPVLRKDGSIIYCDISTGFSRLESEELFFGFFRDVSDRKKREDDLRNERIRFQALAENAPFGMVMITADGRFTYINNNFKTIFGYQLSEIPTGREWFRKAYPDDEYRHEVIAAWIQDLQSSGPGKEGPRIFTARAKDGREKVIHFRTVQFETGEHLMTCEDITHKWQAEEKLRDSEEQFRRIVENLPDVFYRAAIDGTLTLLSPSSERMLGYKPEGILGHDMAELHVDPSEWQEFIGIILDEGIVQGFETRLEKRDGEIAWVSTSARSYHDSDGRTAGVEGIARDITDQKKMEMALRESEEMFRLLSEQSLMSVAILQDGVIRYANEAMARLLEYSVEEILDWGPEGFLKATHPDDRAFVLQQARMKQTGDPGQKTAYSFRVITESNTTKWVEIFSKTVQFKGRPANLMTMLDITNRKLAEEHIRLNEARLQSLYDISQYRAESIQDLLDVALSEALKLTGSRVGYIYHYDEETQVFELNTWSKEVMQRCEVANPQTRYELVKTGIWGEAVRQRKPIVVNDFQASNSLKKGYPHGHVKLHNFMTVPIFSGDKIVAVIGAGNKPSDYDDNDIRQLAVLMDSVLRIADGRRSELVQRRLATALEHAAEGIMITDIQGMIQYVNPALAQMTGYTRDELLGENARIFKSGEHDDNTFKDLWRTIVRGKVWEGRLINRKKDGSLYTEDITISPVRDSSGTITNFVAVKRDITEHLALSRQLSHSQKMEAIGTLAGGIAHDFNNLLMVILGYADLLIQNKQRDDRDRAKLEEIRRAARDGADLVKRILTFSKRVESKVRPIDLNEEIRRIEKLIVRTIPKMIEVELSLGDDLSIVNADPAQIEQIILNLAVNAHHAMPEGGRLVIETKNASLREDYVAIHADVQPGEYVILSVSDTGAGIDPTIADRIFEPFFTTKDGTQGTGLGLSMVHGIVAQHGGHIHCSSEPGIGTTFKIYFPAVRAEVSDDTVASTEMPALGTETLLLVDDDIRIRDLAAEMLMMAGYDIIQAGNGQQALEIYRERKSEIALVILDLIMPGMSGTQCLKELLEFDPYVRVLISSGYSAHGPAKQLTAAGARGVVTKPYDMKEILRVIRKIIDAGQ